MKKIYKIFLLFTVLFLYNFCISANATIYYVDTSCSDVSTYDPATPACTGGSDIVKNQNSDINAIDFANGDHISFRKGQTFTDATITLGSVTSGSSKTIYIEAHGTGDLPKIGYNTVRAMDISISGLNLSIKDINIDGQEWSGSIGQAHIRLDGVGSITLDNIEADGSVGYDTGCTPDVDCAEKEAIRIKDLAANSDVEIKNSDIRNWGGDEDIWVLGKPAYTGADSDCVAITTLLTGSLSIHDNTITNCEADSLKFERVDVSTTIYNNTVWNGGENSIDIKGCENFEVYANKFGRDASWVGQGGSSSDPSGIGGPLVSILGSSSSGGYDNNNHRIHDNEIGLCADGEGIALAATSPYANNNIRVDHNYFHGNKYHWIVRNKGESIVFDNNIIIGLENEGFFLWQSLSTVPSTSPVYKDNSFYVGTDYTSPSFWLGAHDALIMFYDAGASCANPTFENNIIYINDATDDIVWLDTNCNADDFNHNVWYNANAGDDTIIDTSGTDYDESQQTAWRTAGHTGGIFDNPDFTNPSTPDLSLQAGSPAISAGVDPGDTYKYGWSAVTSLPSDSVLVSLIDRSQTQYDIGAYVADTTPPTTVSSGPSGNLSYDTTKILYINLDEDVSGCKYDSSDVAYDSMANSFGSCSGTNCTQSVSVSEGSNTFYARCADLSGNKQTSSTTITFTVQAEEEPSEPSPNAIGQGISFSGGGGMQ